ncbi:FtsK/SpoIIIE domain-containing protein [Streptomyces sp. SCUT-3]|uniref:FtsK/SpoIIIE domain-containing protein n=1 Tax=Streptomyces sp. SCUT-3 TaxID=2684469 RepID=UPI002174FD48|nr:FtsK/SpoIIIE domain-containing protein [Streptomyces sp. SCUT-3]
MLATQRPAGVVTADIRANTNLRIALRVTDTMDSQDVLEVNDAVTIRLHARPGPGAGGAPLGAAVPDGVRGRRAEDAAAAAPAADAPAPAAAADAPIWTSDVHWSLLGRAAAEPAPGRRPRTTTPPPRPTPTAPRTCPSWWTRCARPPRNWRSRRSPARGCRRCPPPSPWATCPAAPTRATAGSRRCRGPWPTYRRRSGRSRWNWTCPPSGTCTSSARRARPFAGAAHRRRALARRHSSADVHLYGIDAAGGALAALTALPHCGAVVPRADLERLGRLHARLLAEMARRQELLAAHGVASLPELRGLLPAAERPAHVCC